jgi:hypothetical protein
MKLGVFSFGTGKERILPKFFERPILFLRGCLHLMSRRIFQKPNPAAKLGDFFFVGISKFLFLLPEGFFPGLMPCFPKTDLFLEILALPSKFFHLSGNAGKACLFGRSFFFGIYCGLLFLAETFLVFSKSVQNDFMSSVDSLGLNRLAGIVQNRPEASSQRFGMRFSQKLSQVEGGIFMMPFQSLPEVPIFQRKISA